MRPHFFSLFVYFFVLRSFVRFFALSLSLGHTGCCRTLASFRVLCTQQAVGKECLQLSRSTRRATSDGAERHYTPSGDRRYGGCWGHLGLAALWLG